MVEDGRKFEYAIFFTVTKANKTDGADLNLFINSAHKRIDALKHKKPIKFFTILLFHSRVRTFCKAGGHFHRSALPMGYVYTC